MSIRENNYIAFGNKYENMDQNELSKLSDDELKKEVAKIKPSPIIDAFLIGFLIGIIIFSVAVNSWGFLTLIPLFLIYGLLKKSKRYDALRKEIKSRDLE